MANKVLFVIASVLGAVAILWMGANFLGGHALALGVTAVIGVAYLIGIAELLQFRRVTQNLGTVLDSPTDAAIEHADPLDNWLSRLHPSLRHVTRLRIEGQRVLLPAPVLTPYLVGLLVMLGLLGTFFGMVDTLSGAVVALQGNTDLAAIRAGLAAPIAGLGVAFGTSVAGVAASAMLGLGATLSRRDRMEAVSQLDIYADREFRQYSVSHRRQQAFDAMQNQSAALPAVVEKLDQLADKVSAMTSDLGNRLLANQSEFHQNTSLEYRELAGSVGSSLQQSLAESGKLAGDSILPAVESAMANFNDSTAQVHAKLSELTAEQSRASARQSTKTIQKIQGIVSDGLSEQKLSQQRIAGQFEQTLKDTVAQLGQTAHQQSERQLARVGELLAASEQLLQARMDSESSWLAQHSERMEGLTTTVGDQLGKLRSDEELRGAAAIERLAALEVTVAEHLGKLGTELEEPMTRLIEAVSETPRAAAEVIARLREESSKGIEKDNQLLEERQRVLERLEVLLSSLESSSGTQREAVEQMVASSAGALAELGERFGEQVGEGVSRMSGLTDNIAGSAAEVASLGEAFQQAVQQFGESNQALIDSLDRIEQAMDQSSTRSDEQLGYYVAQAREIIDHSMLSQKEIIEELRHLGRQEELFEAAT